MESEFITLSNEWSQITGNYLTSAINAMFPNGYISFMIQRKRNKISFESIIADLKKFD